MARSTAWAWFARARHVLRDREILAARNLELKYEWVLTAPFRIQQRFELRFVLSRSTFRSRGSAC
jgi:hypothetical protein